MPKNIRIVVGHKAHELVARADQGLPLPPTETTKVLLMGVIARAQRDNKVVLNNLVWMSNHYHMQVIPKDPAQFPNFYGEVQKKTTEAVKALRGAERLELWKDGTTDMVLYHLGDVVDRLVYLFCNPTKAGLVNRIEDYPGLNSWDAFVNCEASVDAEVEFQARWYPSETIPRLPPSGRLSHQADRQMVEILNSTPDVPTHTLVIKPLAWLKEYGITDPVEVEKYRQEVIRRVRANEALYREERLKNNRQVIGREALRCESYLQEHRPKKKERRIFLICSNTESRISVLAWFQDIFNQCRACYLARKKGLAAIWPPGTFPPWSAPGECNCEI